MVACPPILEEYNSSSVGRGTAFPHSRGGRKGLGTWRKLQRHVTSDPLLLARPHHLKFPEHLQISTTSCEPSIPNRGLWGNTSDSIGEQ